jgi:hypothetical protein
MVKLHLLCSEMLRTSTTATSMHCLWDQNTVKSVACRVSGPVKFFGPRTAFSAMLHLTQGNYGPQRCIPVRIPASLHHCQNRIKGSKSPAARLCSHCRLKKNHSKNVSNQYLFGVIVHNRFFTVNNSTPTNLSTTPNSS